MYDVYEHWNRIRYIRNLHCPEQATTPGPWHQWCGFDLPTADLLCYILGAQNWISTLEIVYLELCLSDETLKLKAIGPFYLL